MSDKQLKIEGMKHYIIISEDKEWSYNYENGCCEWHKQIGTQPYKFSDLALAKKEFIENELEYDDYQIVDTTTGLTVYPV